MALPAQYRNATPADELDTASSDKDSNAPPAKPKVAQEASLAEWWRSFGNPELVELVDRGLANNSDVRIATFRIAQAKARADQARAGLMPNFIAPIEVSGGTAGSTTGGTASVRGNWRVDIWGEQSALAESARFQLWRSAFERDDVQRNMAASLASSYVEFLALNDRLKVARKTEAILKDMLATIKIRVDAGDAAMTDLDQQKSTIYAIRAATPLLEQQREDALTTMAFLMGTVPGALQLSSNGLDTLYLPAAIPALPSSLLLRRPDVRMAEARLLAADADVDVARARILPPLDLSVQAGFSLSIARLFQPSALFWNALANMTAVIFDSGKLASEKENAQALHEEMVETYARTIYQAVGEVERALAAIRLNGQRLEEQQEVITSSRRTLKRSAEAYASKGIDYMVLLDAERTYHHYLDEYHRIRMDYYRAYISLFQALGGGVSFDDPLPGKGARPASVRSDTPGSVNFAAPEKAMPSGGTGEITPSSAGDNASPPTGNFWQIELAGLFSRSTIDATWRDLRSRYPDLMKNRSVQPRLHGRIEDSPDDAMSWYRLYIGQFATPGAAHELCAALQANYQRCRVVSSHPDETVTRRAVGEPQINADPALAENNSPAKDE